MSLESSVNVRTILKEWRTSIHSLTAMYSCALRGGTADCQTEQSAVLASLRSVQGGAPLAALPRLTPPAPGRGTPAGASVPLPGA